VDFTTQLALLLRWICSEKASPFMDTCAWRCLYVFGLFLSSRQPVELHGLDRFLCRLGKYSRVPSCCLVPLHQPREIGVLGRVRFGPKAVAGLSPKRSYGLSKWASLRSCGHGITYVYSCRWQVSQGRYHIGNRLTCGCIEEGVQQLGC